MDIDDPRLKRRIYEQWVIRFADRFQRSDACSELEQIADAVEFCNELAIVDELQENQDRADVKKLDDQGKREWNSRNENILERIRQEYLELLEKFPNAHFDSIKTHVVRQRLPVGPRIYQDMSSRIESFRQRRRTSVQESPASSDRPRSTAESPNGDEPANDPRDSVMHSIVPHFTKSAPTSPSQASNVSSLTFLSTTPPMPDDFVGSAESMSVDNPDDSSDDESDRFSVEKEVSSVQIEYPRPTATDAWYSASFVPSNWDNIQPQRQRQLCHIGLIEETWAGELRDDRCERCERLDLPCKTINKAGFAHYRRSGSFERRTCTRCTYNGAKCSFSSIGYSPKPSQRRRRSTKEGHVSRKRQKRDRLTTSSKTLKSPRTVTTAPAQFLPIVRPRKHSLRRNTTWQAEGESNGTTNPDLTIAEPSAVAQDSCVEAQDPEIPESPPSSPPRTQSHEEEDPNDSDFQPTTTRLAPSSQPSMSLRRPLATHEFYSHRTDPSVWPILDMTTKRRLHHIGLIHETSAGTVRDEWCDRCLKSGFACMTYSEQGAKTNRPYHRSRKYDDERCTRCSFGCYKCSLTMTGEKKGGEEDDE